MSAESDLNNLFVKKNVEDGDLGMFLEHAADANLSGDEFKKLLSQALTNRADKKAFEADTVDGNWKKATGIENAGSFERRRASNLRRLAEQILNLK